MAEKTALDGLKETVDSATSPVHDIATKSNVATPASGTIQATNQIPKESNEHEGKHDEPTRITSEVEASTDLNTALNESVDSTSFEGAANADTSGGSDTDTSRTDAADPAQGASSGHARSNSVKKPTTFKSVSVTKNFLAKATPVAPNIRTGEKGTAVGLGPTPLTAKPRLVAKSALGNAGSRTGLSKQNGASGPDASKVWNKNRPVPPPPPRQFTDEELQTRYGIHLATRLQSDEAGKDPKWADIDDDEDDWAPEDVEWMDGTKSSVAPAGEQSAPAIEEKKEKALTPAPGEAVTPGLTSVEKPLSSTTVKTILKPSVPNSGQPRTGGLVLKGAPEKTTLVAKTPAGPSKSPWAPLPPIDRVSPVVITAPVQQQQQSSRFQRDPHGFDSLPPAPLPAKEIAADDFNRSWRGPDDRAIKELYNFQSDRYEPVTEGRRGSRNDQSHRQPAVLQRPPNHGQAEPAGPSAAFQTSRSGGTETGSWAARRRASSNLSGGSTGRRPSFGRLSDLPSRPEIPEGTSPINAVAVESPQLKIVNTDRLPDGQSLNMRALPNASEKNSTASAVPANNDSTNSEVQTPFEDNTARQQRLMREKIELARVQKQREKEVEKEEAKARAERLSHKLAALAVSSPSLEDKKPKEPTAAIKSPQQQGLLPAASPPKPPIPTSAGEVAQYGMMKVHQPHPVKKAGITETPLISKQPFESSTDHNHGPRRAGSPMRPVARGTQSQQERNTVVRIPTRVSDGPSDPPSGPWKSPSPSESYNWGSNMKSMNAHSVPGGNVWAPSREKTLGNGTFETHTTFGVSTSSSHSNNFNNSRPATIAHGAPGPIAPPSGHKPSPRDTNFTSHIHEQQTLSSSSSHTQPPSNQSIQQHTSPHQITSKMSSTQVLPSPVMESFAATVDASGQPKGRGIQQPAARQQGRITGNRRPPGASIPLPDSKRAQHSNNAWTTFSSTVREDEHAAAVIYATEYKKNLAMRTEEPSLQLAAQKAIFVQTGKAKADVPGNRREILNTVETILGDDGESVDNSLAQGAPAMAITHSQASQVAGAARSSRFFPRNDSARPNSLVSFDAPPPPECSSLEVKVGNGEKAPTVHLPPPKPNVRLPGGHSASSSTGFPPNAKSVLALATSSDVEDTRPGSAVDTAQAQGTHAMGSRPIVRQEAWQDRFNALLGNQRIGGVAGPPYGFQHAIQQSPAIISSSKAPLIQPAKRDSTVVALPNKTAGLAAVVVHVSPIAVDNSSAVTTKAEADEDLFEPPAFASTPTVRLPTQAHLNNHLGYTHDSRLKMETLTRPIPIYAQTFGNPDLFPHTPIDGPGYRIFIKVGPNLKVKSVEYRPFRPRVSRPQPMPIFAPKNGSFRKSSNANTRRNITPNRPTTGDVITQNLNDKKSVTRSPKPIGNPPRFSSWHEKTSTKLSAPATRT